MAARESIKLEVSADDVAEWKRVTCHRSRLKHWRDSRWWTPVGVLIGAAAFFVSVWGLFNSPPPVQFLALPDSMPAGGAQMLPQNERSGIPIEIVKAAPARAPTILTDEAGRPITTEAGTSISAEQNYLLLGVPDPGTSLDFSKPSNSGHIL